MKEKVKKMIEEKRVNPQKTYQHPFLILLTGNVGSGKSLVAQILSKELNLYLISGDNIRNIIKDLYPEINLDIPEVRQTNNIICLEEMKYCINNKYSIILDRNVSSQDDLSYIEEKIDLPIIFIKIISSTKEDIKRVKKRNQQQELIIPHYGHQDSRSGVVTEEEYNKIKERKIYDLDNSIYDYFINTNVSLDELKISLRSIIDDIKRTIK